MSGDGLVPPLNAPPAGQLVSGVQPGVTNGIIIANIVIIFGPTGSATGLFIYQPGTTPGPGNPPIAWETANSKDPYGNTLQPGIMLAEAASSGNAEGGLIWNTVTPGTAEPLLALFPDSTLGFAGNSPFILGHVYNRGLASESLSLALGGGATSGTGAPTMLELLGKSKDSGVTTWPRIKFYAGQEFNPATGAVPSQVVYPSGDTSGVIDTRNINAVISQVGGACQLIPADLNHPYWINTPLLPASQARLWGAWWSRASGNDFYGVAGGASTGTVIRMTGGFTGDAAISMPDPGAGVQNFGVDLCGFTVEGFSVPSGTIYGLHAVGAWGSCNVRGVTLHRTPADCFRCEPSGVTGFAPDEWQISQCAFSGSRFGYGAYLSFFDDAWITDTESSANLLDQWYVVGGVNTRFTSCKAEDSQGGTTVNGFHFGGLKADQCLWLTGCSTHLNTANGFLFDDTGSGSGTGLGTYVLTGCIAQQDGSASATAGYAGFRDSGCKSRIFGTGCFTQTDAAKPQYGANETSSAFGMAFTGSLLQGHTAATNDDGTNTHALVNQSPVPF